MGKQLLLLALLLLGITASLAQDDEPEEYEDEPDDYEDDPPPEVDKKEGEERAPSDKDYSVPGEPTENCICVPFYQCEDGEIVSDGTNLINPRRRVQPTELPLEEKYTAPECGPYHVCCSDPESVTVKPYKHRCGTRNPGGINGRILSAQESGEAEFGEWPWQAAILKKDGTSYIFQCGGTLIDENHVITVAHCADKFLNDISSMIIRLGEWDTQNTGEFLPHEDYGVEEIILHPEYKKKNLFNDLAVLKLDSEVKYKPNIDAICLPKPDDDFTGKECVVTGWGTNAYKSGAYSLIMKEIAVPVLSHSDCQKKLRLTRLGRYFKLHSGFTCAGGEKGKDSCKGDGGGPLVCFNKDYNSYTVAGLVAWGIDCGQPGIPGVYVNVAKYIDWIASVTNKPLPEYWSKEDSSDEMDDALGARHSFK